MGSLNTDTKKLVWENSLRARYEENIQEVIDGKNGQVKIGHVKDFNHGIVTWTVTSEDCMGSKTEVNYFTILLECHQFSVFLPASWASKSSISLFNLPSFVL